MKAAHAPQGSGGLDVVQPCGCETGHLGLLANGLNNLARLTFGEGQIGCNGSLLWGNAKLLPRQNAEVSEIGGNQKV